MELFTAKFAGESAWERHPQGNEIVQIVDGATTLHLITPRDGSRIMPRNDWHQSDAPNGVCLMTATPQPTEHVREDVADPTARVDVALL